MVRESKTVYTCSEPAAARARAGSGSAPQRVEHARRRRRRAAAATRNQRFQSLAKAAPVATLSQIEASDVERTPTGHRELDRVLGGGIVEGGVVLIGGDPGIGKKPPAAAGGESLSGADRSPCTSPARRAARRSRCLRGAGLPASQVRVLAEIHLESILPRWRPRRRRWS